MLTNPDRFRRLHTARCTLFRRSPSINLDNVCAVQVAFVFEERDELSPRRILLVPSVPVALKHSSNVQVFYEHGIVLFDKPRRELVLIVQHFASDAALELGDFDSLFLVVVRLFLFPREFALLSAESFILVFEVEPIDGLAVARVDVVEDAEVDSNAVVRVERVHVGFLGDIIIVGFQSEGDEPLASCLLLDGDFFDVRVVRNWAVVANPYVSNFGEF